MMSGHMTWWCHHVLMCGCTAPKRWLPVPVEALYRACCNFTPVQWCTVPVNIISVIGWCTCAYVCTYIHIHTQWNLARKTTNGTSIPQSQSSVVRSLNSETDKVREPGWNRIRTYCTYVRSFQTVGRVNFKVFFLVQVALSYIHTHRYVRMSSVLHVSMYVRTYVCVSIHR